MIEDYIHFITNHNDPASITKIQADLKCQCVGTLARCRMTARHYRSRFRERNEIVHIDIMDSLHFNLYHLEEAGLRVKVRNNVSTNQSNGDLVDSAMLGMFKEIRGKRKQHFFERLNDTKSTKFSLSAPVPTTTKKYGRQTSSDRFLSDFKKAVGNNDKMMLILRFLEQQQYDTDAMNDDMVVYAETLESNISNVLKDNSVDLRSVRQLLCYHRISASSFSTGIWWTYWSWYKTQTVHSLLTHFSTCWNNVDFDGHSLKNLYVEPHFENLKEEALNSGHISKTAWQMCTKKTEFYLYSAKCRKMVFNEDGKGDILHFGIPQHFKTSAEHILSALLYTDCSAFCKALSETFRALDADETIEEINGRNSMYYWTSRYLRELVFCFGFQSWEAKRCFFSGIKVEMNMPQFQVGFVGPTSTSWVKEVAINFAGERGMLVCTEGGRNKCFEASWLSAFPEEKEVLFFGSRKRATLSSIIVARSAKNYHVAVGAYAKFDAIFSWKKVKPMDSLEIEIIKESLRWIKGDDDNAVNHPYLDLFILETFYSFVIHKKLVFLCMYMLQEDDIAGNEIIDLVTNKLCYDWEDVGDKPDNVNMIKPFVFDLFRQLRQIRIDAPDNGFDLLLFLNMISTIHLPDSLEIIIIDGDWLEDAFNEEVAEQFIAKGFKTEFEDDYTLSVKLKYS